ncbi:hypothetical protein WJX79_007270 [Trebouxia sp. C0005]
MAADRSTYRYGRPDVPPEISPLLDAVGNPGQFACGPSDPSALLPGLAVAGFGDMNLPSDPGRAQNLLKFCQAAPRVKGADTVGDVSVRISSQLDPALLSCNNPGTVCLLES